MMENALIKKKGVMDFLIVLIEVMRTIVKYSLLMRRIIGSHGLLFQDHAKLRSKLELR